MDLSDILNLNRLQCTGEQSRAGWYLDQDAIIEAMDMMEIHLPVIIRYMTGIYRGGTHYSRGDHHKVTVDQNKSAQEASNILWHELAHCMQAERYARETGTSINKFHDYYKSVAGDWGERYEGNMMEIEANRISDENTQSLLVVYAT